MTRQRGAGTGNVWQVWNDSTLFSLEELGRFRQARRVAGGALGVECKRRQGPMVIGDEGWARTGKAGENGTGLVKRATQWQAGLGKAQNRTTCRGSFLKEPECLVNAWRNEAAIFGWLPHLYIFKQILALIG